MEHEVRMLTLRQPWASAITDLGKRVENRRFTPRVKPGSDRVFDGYIALHAGLGYDEDAVTWFDNQPHEVDPSGDFRDIRGVIIGVARVESVHQAWAFHEPVAGCYDDPWAEWGEGIVHWHLTEVQKLNEPIPATGVQGLRGMSEELAERVMAATWPTEREER